MPRESMRVAVDGPTAEPLPYGLLSAAIVEDSQDPHVFAGTNWLSFICGEAGITDWCVPVDESPGESPGDESPGSGEKDFNRPDSDTAPPIIVYYGAECTAVSGYDFEQANTHARLGLELGEQKALEQWVMHELLSKKAIDLTPSMTALSLPAAVAAVEAGLADRYTGRGILHIPAGVAAMLGQAHQIREDARGYYSWLGHRIALGIGYQTNIGPIDPNTGLPEIAPPGSAWIYASGPVVVRRSEVIVSPPTDGESFNTRTNDRNVVAERGFVVEISCAVVAALADISCCC